MTSTSPYLPASSASCEAIVQSRKDWIRSQLDGTTDARKLQHSAAFLAEAVGQLALTKHLETALEYCAEHEFDAERTEHVLLLELVDHLTCSAFGGELADENQRATFRGVQQVANDVRQRIMAARNKRDYAPIK